MKPSRQRSPSFMHWLGRQVGHVRKAVRKPVGEQVIYRRDQVSEHPLPDQPEFTLRRTTIDEVIVRDDADAPHDTPHDAPHDTVDQARQSS